MLDDRRLLFLVLLSTLEQIVRNEAFFQCEFAEVWRICENWIWILQIFVTLLFLNISHCQPDSHKKSLEEKTEKSLIELTGTNKVSQAEIPLLRSKREGKRKPRTFKKLNDEEFYRYIQLRTFLRYVFYNKAPEEE